MRGERRKFHETVSWARAGAGAINAGDLGTWPGLGPVKAQCILYIKLRIITFRKEYLAISKTSSKKSGAFLS